jgi:hypothetical protein
VNLPVIRSSSVDLGAFMAGANPLRGKESRIVMGKTVAVNQQVEVGRAGSSFRVDYQIFNRLKKPARFIFSCQWMIPFKDAQVNRPGEAGPLRRFAVLDPASRQEAVWSFSRAAQMTFSPVEKQTNGRRYYRGAWLRGSWPVTLKPMGRWTINYEWKVGQPCGGL